VVGVLDVRGESWPCKWTLVLEDVSDFVDCARFKVELRVGPRAEDVLPGADARGMREVDAAETGLRGLLLVAEANEAEDLSLALERASTRGMSILRLGLLALPTVAALTEVCTNLDFCTFSMSVYS